MNDHERTLADAVFLGIDLGTGGVRVVAVTERGLVLATTAVPFAAETHSPREMGRHEQSPAMWWQAVCQAAKTTVEGLDAKARAKIQAVAVDGTSGTLVVVGQDGSPLRPAMMYNDSRAEGESAALNVAAGDFCGKLGYRFNSSFALTKIAWLRTSEPSLFDKAARFIHQADFIVERLTGEPATTDYSNALKTGYDLIDDCWPTWIETSLGISSRLPHVVPPGTPIGRLSAKAAEDTGLPAGLAIVAGASDGTAAFVASGARRPGDYNTTLGTTLVFKGISERICRDPNGLIYCHKLPGGWWLPGAAGNVGAEWIASLFPEPDVHSLDAAAAAKVPSDVIAYPLVRTGERFPFLASKAVGFFTSEKCDVVDRYAACLQGVGFVERLAYDVLDRAMNASGGDVFSTGGGSRSDVWMQCRADATGRTLHRPSCGESAFGSAILASCANHYGSVVEAIAKMVRVDRTFEPNRQKTSTYDDLFHDFLRELHDRGYW
jgi:xylulokinase